MKEFEYLSDEELESLISSAEQELVKAPANIEEAVLKGIAEENEKTDARKISANTTDVSDEIARPPQIISLEKKKREYRRFCTRIAMSIAVAIIFCFAVPGLLEIKSGVYSRSSVLSERVKSKNEEMDKTSFGKLGSTHLISDILGNKKIY